MNAPHTTVNRREAEQLQHRYAGLAAGSSVAYVDESYRLPADCRDGEEPFYVLAAVVLPVDDHAAIRGELDRIAGHTMWHTTDRQRTPEGRAAVEAMVDYLAAYSDPCIIAVSHTPGEHDTGRAMRAVCLTTLMGELCSPTSSLGAPVPMVVFEKQREHQDTDRDRHTIREAIKAGTVPRHTAAHFVSPAIENLLWLPDLVSNTYRRYVTHHDDLVTRLDGQTLTVTVPLNASDPLAAAAHVQGVSPLFP